MVKLRLRVDIDIIRLANTLSDRDMKDQENKTGLF